MTVEIHAIARARAFSEATFAADASASLASFTDIPAQEGSMSLEIITDSHNPNHLVQHLDDYPIEVLGKRSAKLTMTLPLAPTGTAAGPLTTAVQGPLGLLLKASMGGEFLGTGSTGAAGSTATVLNVGTGKGVGYSVGGVIGWVNTSGVLEVREIESIATDAVTVKYAFSGVPATSAEFYSGATYYLTQNPTETLQFLVAGAESDDRWLLCGGQLTSVGLALDPTGGAIPNLQLTYEFATYLESDETASAITGAIGFATYSNYSPIVGHVGELRVAPVGQATFLTSHRVHASVIGYTPKFTFVRVTSPSGTMTVFQWRRSRVAPVIEGEFTLPFQDLTWNALRDARSPRAIWYQLGVTAGSSVMLSAPTTQIVNPQRTGDGVGIAAQTVAWKGRLDGDVSSTTTDAAKSAFRIHLI